MALAAIFIAVIALVGAADVVGTAGFRFPFPGALEISELSLVIIVFMGLAQTQHEGAHITVDILSNGFKGKLRWVSQATSLLSAIVFFTFIAVLCGQEAWHSMMIDERALGAWPLPVWPGRIMLALGCTIAALETLRRFVHLCLGTDTVTQKTSSEAMA
ncbi:TRAP transporter small permease subunit [Hoeflea sp.]|uniref:TRAP transporter small permease subunit n=1 Tax=Hoeflea sp. TaxID=1940281 RepID=UPI003A8DC094